DGVTTYQNGPDAASPRRPSAARVRTFSASVDARMIEPAHAPARLVGPRAARSVVDRKIRNRDEPPAVIEKRNPRAHPRHDALLAQPRLQPSMMRGAGRLEALAAAAKAHVEPFDRPRL